MSVSFQAVGKYTSIFAAAVMCSSHSAIAHESSSDFHPAAARVTMDNAAAYRVGGMDSQGGLGDWFLSNGTLCAIVSDPTQESSITRQGGFLTDLGFCGKEDDHFLSMYATQYMNLDKVIDFETVEAKMVDGVAQIKTIGRQNGLEITVLYRAAPDVPNILDIRTEVTRVSAGEPMQRYGEVLLTAHSMPVFDISISREAPSNGFSHVENQPNSADLTVLVGNGDPGHNIVYGYHHISAELVKPPQPPLPLRSFDMTGSEFTARLAVLGGDLQIGDTLRFHQEIILAEGTAISPITDQLWPQGFGVEGRVGEEGVVLLVEEPDANVVTQAISDVNGAFKFRVPRSGDYALKIRATGREEMSVPFLVDDKATDLGSIALAPPAVVTLPEKQVMRLSFRGVDGTNDPDFISAHINHQVKKGDQWVKDRVSRHVFLSGDESDEKSVILAPGKYRVTASRGPEFSVHQTTLTLSSGQETKLSIDVPQRVVNTPGYMSADFHVHSGQSFDNNLGTKPRLKSYVAQGAEILVATEHDTIYDFTDLIESMGLASKLKTVTGTELTTELGNPTVPFGLGHANIFPLKVQALLPRRGAPKHENHRWRDVISELRVNGDRPLVQLNHPLGEKAGAVSAGLYFSHLAVAGKSFDPSLALSEAPNNVMIEADSETGVRDIDFDIIEIENGNRWGERYEATRDAWFALLRQGIPIVAAANSDSHGVGNGELAANVRNMVFTGANELSDYKESEFLQGIRSGNLYGTNGPLLEVSLNGASLGGLASGLTNQQSADSGEGKHVPHNAVLSLRVNAAEWMRVNHYKLYINGELESEASLTVGENLILPLMMSEDAFVTVEVMGPITALSKEVIGNVPPFAFSNPVFFDANGDREWTPVGMPLPK